MLPFTFSGHSFSVGTVGGIYNNWRKHDHDDDVENEQTKHSHHMERIQFGVGGESARNIGSNGSNESNDVIHNLGAYTHGFDHTLIMTILKLQITDGNGELYVNYNTVTPKNTSLPSMNVLSDMTIDDDMDDIAIGRTGIDGVEQIARIAGNFNTGSTHNMDNIFPNETIENQLNINGLNQSSQLNQSMTNVNNDGKAEQSVNSETYIGYYGHNNHNNNNNNDNMQSNSAIGNNSNRLRERFLQVTIQAKHQV